MQHLDEGTIHAWLDGALTAEQGSDVERHVRDCAECAAMVADARGMIAGAARIVSALDDVPAGVIPKQQPVAASRSLWRTLHLTPLRAAMAASLMVAAASLAVIRHAPLNESKADAARVTIELPAAAPPAPLAPAVAAPAVTPLNKKLESVARQMPAELAKQPAPAAAPRGGAEREEKVAGALDSAKTTVAFDSVRSGVAGGVARASDTTRATSQVMAEAARRSQTGVANAAPNAPAMNATTAREMAQRNSGLKVADAVLTGASSFSFTLTSDNGRPLALPGCYQIVRDSLGAGVRLPDRFSLDTEPGAQHNVVRRLTQDGRRDSVIAGLTWRPAPGADHFVFISSVAQPGALFAQTPSARFRQDAAGSSSRGASGSATLASARLSRLECR